MVLVMPPGGVEELLSRGRNAIERARLLQRRAEQALLDSTAVRRRAQEAVRRSFVARDILQATGTTCGLRGLEVRAFDHVNARNDDLVHEACDRIVGSEGG